MRPAHDWVWLATVLRWVDGDTVVLDIDRGMRDRTIAPVRLLGADTPEVRGRLRWGTRALARRAAARAAELAPPGSLVVVRTHPDEEDKYGRWLAEVWPADTDASVAETLISEGLARPA